MAIITLVLELMNLRLALLCSEKTMVVKDDYLFRGHWSKRFSRVNINATLFDQINYLEPAGNNLQEATCRDVDH
jgi:hypothetical protein